MESPTTMSRVSSVAPHKPCEELKGSDTRNISDKDNSSFVHIRTINGREMTRLRLDEIPPSFKPKTEPLNPSSDLVVVLDMDECLLHTNKWRFCDRYCSLRPGLVKFLKTTMSKYETHVFTASLQYYADPILNVLEDLVGLPFAGRWFRHNCTSESDGMVFVKDLQATLKLRDGTSGAAINMARIVAVDDNTDTFGANQSNGIPIRDFYGNEEDTCLEVLSDFLSELEGVQDVRPVLEERFKSGGSIENLP